LDLVYYYPDNVKKNINEDSSITYILSNNTGEGFVKQYNVFSGIEIFYHSMHLEKCDYDKIPIKDTIEINFCTEGRIESELNDGKYIYIGKSDLSIFELSHEAINSTFPLNHYHGISILINIPTANISLNNIAKSMNLPNIDLYEIRDNLKNENSQIRLIIRNAKEINHIFEELNSAPKELLEYYFKLKVLEIILFLSKVDGKSIFDTPKYYYKNQVNTIKNIKKFLTENISNNYTIKELSSIFNISESSLKECFKDVYGTTIYSFTRSYRMDLAAKLLSTTNDTILEIALKSGYKSPGKFSSNFKTEFNLLPSDYRKIKKQNNQK